MPQLFEVTIGVPDLAAALRYWAAFGYTPGPFPSWRSRQTGNPALEAAAAERLYGVASPVRSFRLTHQTADHGLIRLMEWAQPTGPGLGFAPLASLGSRWTAQRTTDLAHLELHVAVAQAQGREVKLFGPVGGGDQTGLPNWQPFLDDIPGAREIIFFQPHYRQVFYNTFAQVLPNYGTINEKSRFKVTQITHAGLVLQGDDRVLDFYVEALGMWRSLDPASPGPQSLALFDLPTDAGGFHRYWVQDPPRVETDHQFTHSGRLIVLKFPDAVTLPDQRAVSSTGCLGMSSYSFRVADIAASHARVGRSEATEVTPIVANEFGEPSFSFRAPDGYSWIIVGV